MLDDTIALCDAGTGTGKTYAYLVAGLIAQRYRLDQGLIPTPLLISTSSIALQNAILGDYLPFLSNVFLRADLTDAPIQAVIRKGKAHYVCDQRLEKRLRQIRKSGKNHQAVKALLALRDRLDSSEVPHLRPYDRMRVQVPAACHCKEQGCRYRLFLRSCQTNRFQIQICNHNLLLADAIHRSEQLRPILPSSNILIVDEAHKLVDAARQMFGSVLTSEDLRTLTYQLRRERYLLAAEFWKHAAQPLLDKLEEPVDGEDIQAYRPLLAEPYRLLQRMQRQLYGLLSRSTQNLLDHIRSMLQLLGDDHADLLAYPASNGRNGVNLCIASLNLQDHLQATLA